MKCLTKKNNKKQTKHFIVIYMEEENSDTLIWRKKCSMLTVNKMGIKSTSECNFFRKSWAINFLSGLRGKRFTVCTEITIILGRVRRFTIRGGLLRYKRYDANFLKKKSSVELPFSSFGDNLINILRKVNRLIYAFQIN